MHHNAQLFGFIFLIIVKFTLGKNILIILRIQHSSMKYIDIIVQLSPLQELIIFLKLILGSFNCCGDRVFLWSGTYCLLETCMTVLLSPPKYWDGRHIPPCISSGHEKCHFICQLYDMPQISVHKLNPRLRKQRQVDLRESETSSILWIS